MDQEVSLPGCAAESLGDIGGDDFLVAKDLEHVGIARRRRGGLLADNLGPRSMQIWIAS